MGAEVGISHLAGCVPAVTLVGYGRTNTFLVRGEAGHLLVDTDYAGTLPAFFRAIKGVGVTVGDIACVIATHYHPDHCGIIGDLQRLGVRLLLMESQVGLCHAADRIFRREGRRFTPVDDAAATVLGFEGSGEVLSDMGIAAEVIPTPSHSADSVSVVVATGAALVGDLVCQSHLFAYGPGSPEALDWERIRARAPRVVCHAHGPAFRPLEGSHPACRA